MGFDRHIALSYVTAMRSHQEIVKEAGSDRVVAALMGGDIKTYVVRDWRRRNSIPAERWRRFVELRLATFDELTAFAPAPPKEGRRDEQHHKTAAA